MRLRLFAVMISACAAALFTGAANAHSIYLGGGPSIHADAPHGAFNVTTGICDAESTNCALVNYSARGSVRNLKDVVYATTAGFRRVLARATAGSGTVDLFALGNGGAAVTGEAVGFNGSAGGGLTYHPQRAPNWGFTVAAQGAYSPVNPGWKPDVFVQAGYTFRSGK